MVFVVAPDRAEAVLGALTTEHPGRVALRTAYGTRRVVDMPVGELLPRIC
jgi:hydrogenase expression/formation protein HypE